jgi:hypothetical protein
VILHIVSVPMNRSDTASLLIRKELGRSRAVCRQSNEGCSGVCLACPWPHTLSFQLLLAPFSTMLARPVILN